MQLMLNILISTSALGLAAAGISLGLSTTRQIPFTLAAAMSTAAYFCHGMYDAGLPILGAVLLATAIGSAVAYVLDSWLIRPLDEHVCAGWAGVAVSLGAYMVIQAALAIGFGEAGRTFSLAGRSYAIGTGRLTALQCVLVYTSMGGIGALLIVLRFTRIGLAIRGLASNQELCELLGVRTSVYRATAVSVSGALASLAGILVAVDSGLVGNTGFILFLGGTIAAILGGVGSMWGVAGGALLLASSQHLVAYLGDPKWMDTTTFFILILFLSWKPFGFSGRRLKKVEV
ncbi:MAG TPA: branched-chain amino acid ABC transporter permease [Phycisphaerae bacterium]|nr:branched-chain amino acid ABC transporter permease [Phycisphaerae bacterium]